MQPTGIHHGVITYYCQSCRKHIYIANQDMKSVFSASTTPKSKKITYYPMVPFEEDHAELTKMYKRLGEDVLKQKSLNNHNNVTKYTQNSKSFQAVFLPKIVKTKIVPSSSVEKLEPFVPEWKHSSKARQEKKATTSRDNYVPNQGIWMTPPFPDAPTINLYSNQEIPIFVSHGQLRCQRTMHKLQNVNAIIRSARGILSMVPIQKCLTCHPAFFFISAEVLKNREHDVGRLEFIRLQEVPATALDSYQMSPEHELHKLGYNVSSNSNLSATERQALLSHIIEKRVLSKASIMAHLETLLRLNRNNSNMSQALTRWKEDLDFLAEWSDSTEIYNGFLTRRK